MNYDQFLASKKVKYVNSGFHIEKTEINNICFDFQKDVIQAALSKGKYGAFEECGLGKTIQSGEWARIIHERTKGNILVVAPLGVTRQTHEEYKNMLNLDSTICRSQDDVKAGINITNYEMLDKFDTESFVGVVLDESSILKNFTGKMKNKISNGFRNTPYKLSMTATPAPNAYLELLNQAEFLDVMEASKALATWFINDMVSGEWRLKGYAVKDFWQWVASWAVLIDKPSDLGYSDEGYELPKHNEKLELLEVNLLNEDFTEGLIRHIDTSATGFYKEKRRTADIRAKRCAEIATSDNEQYIIWCDTDQESELLKKYIPEATEVRGSDKPLFKEQASQDFKDGKIRVLISKARIFGYGMNFQNCHNAIFCGLTYSYENYYQAVKRLLRFGQKHEVNTWIVLGSTEKCILDTVRAKQEKQRIMKMSIANSIKEIQMNCFFNKKDSVNYFKEQYSLPVWMKEETGCNM